MSRRPPFHPDRMAVVTLVLATVLFWSLPLFAHEIPMFKAELPAVEPANAGTARPSVDRMSPEGEPPTLSQPDADGTTRREAHGLSVRIHTSTAMPADTLTDLLAELERWQGVLPVTFVVRGLPVRRTPTGLAATDHDRAMPFLEALSQRHVALDIDPTVARALDRAYRTAFPDDAEASDTLSLPAVEVRVNGMPLETHVGTVHVMGVLSRIARPTDPDPEAKAHAEILSQALSDPALALLRARVLETAP